MFGSPNSGRLSRDILDTCSGGVQDDCSRFVVDAVVLEGRSLRAVAQEHGVYILLQLAAGAETH